MSNTAKAKPSRGRVIRLVTTKIAQAPRRIPVALELILGLLILIAVGTALLLIPGTATRPLTFMEALFTSTSAAAVTGLSVIPISTELTIWGQIVLLLLVQIGGVSLIVSVLLFFRLIGRQVTLADRLAATYSLGLDSPRQIATVMVRAAALMIIIEGIGAFLLFLHWGFSGIVPIDQAGFYAIFHAVTAYCNAGFDLFYGLPQYPNGFPTDPITLIILGVLIIMGGLGIPIYMDLIYRRKLHKLTLHTRITIKVSLILILVGWVALLISEYRHGGVLSGEPALKRFLLAWFQSVSARTAGFPGLPNFDQLRFDSLLVLMSLMFIGSAPASTGGGITTGTFVVLWMAVVSYARGLKSIRIEKRSLPNNLLLRAAVVFIISLTLVLLATWILLLTNDFSLSETLFEVVSAYSTTGLSLGITSGLNQVGRLVIIATMFCGRLGAITIMIAIIGREQRQKLVEYPEESILVG